MQGKIKYHSGNTDDGEINELVAKAIHNESSRKLKDLLIMHSSQYLSGLSV